MCAFGVRQGTDRTEECLNIFLEFVPGGSISSLLSKFGASRISTPPRTSPCRRGACLGRYSTDAKRGFPSAG